MPCTVPAVMCNTDSRLGGICLAGFEADGGVLEPCCCATVVVPNAAEAINKAADTKRRDGMRGET